MNKEAPQWFRIEINRGLGRLRALKLRNPPSGDQIPGMGMTVADANTIEWVKVLWPSRGWSERSAPFIAEAFEEWPRRNADWPTIAEFLQLFDEVREHARRDEARQQASLPLPVRTPEEQELIKAARERCLAAIGNMHRRMFSPTEAAKQDAGVSSPAEAAYLRSLKDDPNP